MAKQRGRERVPDRAQPPSQDTLENAGDDCVCLVAQVAEEATPSPQKAKEVIANEPRCPPWTLWGAGMQRRHRVCLFTCV